MSAYRANRMLKSTVNAYNRIEQEKAVIEKREPELLPNISCHYLWHTFCTRIIENGISIKAAQYLMGHHYAGTTVKNLSLYYRKQKQERNESA